MILEVLINEADNLEDLLKQIYRIEKEFLISLNLKCFDNTKIKEIKNGSRYLKLYSDKILWVVERENNSFKIVEYYPSSYNSYRNSNFQ